jgi:teichuronic acid biosynthesis glycosyltransferase TuaG
LDGALSQSNRKNMGNSISVIIPTWNRSEDTLCAVKSVLNQTYKDFEIIIVDDGSKDQTEDVFSKFPDKRVRYIQIEHSGLPAKARNMGINNAKGEWIAFLDSDDEWVPEKLAIQVEYCKSHPDVGLVCSNAEVYQDSEFKKLFFKDENIHDTLYSLFLYSNFIITSSVLVKRDLLHSIGWFSEDPTLRGIEDFDLWVKICYDNLFHYLDQPLLKYKDQPLQSIRSEVANDQYIKGMLAIYQSTLIKLIRHGRLSFKFGKLLFQRIQYYRCGLRN